MPKPCPTYLLWFAISGSCQGGREFLWSGWFFLAQTIEEGAHILILAEPCYGIYGYTCCCSDSSHT